jgi:hypothetical protein
MTWVTWRQFRGQAVVAAAALVVMLATALALGPHLAHLYDVGGLPGCRSGCSDIAHQYLNRAMTRPTQTAYDVGTGLVILAPVVVGLFWGAPLVARELESGTFRLAWTQSVSRTRWLGTKLAVVGGAGMLTAGGLGLLLTWWAGPLDAASANRLDALVFVGRGVVPIGYAAFAFTLGVAAGSVLRRTVPAMGATLAGFAVAQIATVLWVRQHLAPAVHATLPLDLSSPLTFDETNGGHMSVVATPEVPGAWVMSNSTITPSGTLFTGPANQAACNRSQPVQTCMDWVGSLHLRQSLVYQPVSNFWRLQWAETGIYLALALALAGASLWWVRRRLV